MEEGVPLKRRTEPPVETPCNREALRRIYQRQFNELAPLRRHILSLLPLGQVEMIFEPGCGTGLLGAQIKSLTNAGYTGMDIDGEIIPAEGNYIQGDVLNHFQPADIYITSFFFSSLKNPVKWLKKLDTDFFVVLSEYDYMSIEEEPHGDIAEMLRKGLEADGLYTDKGGRLDECFGKAGFVKLHGGDVESTPEKPDREFLSLHIPELPCELPLMSWRIVWGIWRKP